MRLAFWIALFFAFGGSAYAQTMPQQQNCTTTTSGSISHTNCAPLVVQVQAPAVTVQPAPVQLVPAPKPAPQAAPVSPAKPKE